MICLLSHRTRYDFSRPVFLEPHLLRLLPRPDACQRVRALEVEISPEPAGRSLYTDLSGNAVLSVWFASLTGHLDVHVAASVETLRKNPFDYLLEARQSVLPVPLAPGEALVAAPCLAQTGLPDGAAAALAGRLIRDGADTPQTFVLALLGWMSENLVSVAREEPGLLSPDAVLAAGEGACRDLALCYIAGCRHAGIPARFVSGYHEGDPEREERDLHAWAEAWLPGGGWRGFDPSLGLAVADRHVAVAAAADPADAAPVVGTFRGEAPSARLTHAVRFQLAEAG
ncbi:transglutaminase family protein [Solidesulfovibrio sp.]|uniref:transglutaminase family protein n=1 Tax=Solidesulfovibrio sp. TaxID=2910990 RepID=UPI002B1FEFDF|nr:transglutaminase family protein [Solidesulfovibrio sp.]MEA5089889.1 transglutaminase family protein [Solidesulfovibrio sp.]